MVIVFWIGDNMKVGFIGLLTLLFITLKLCSVIDWSWIWVLSPIWIYAIIFVLIIVIYTIVKMKDE